MPEQILTRSSKPSHLDVISRLCNEIDAVLGPLVAPDLDAPYALLDFPNHSNVGDSAIYNGEVAWLTSRFHRSPACVSDVTATREQAPLPARGLIFLHGGGNFGDIYPRHQTYREAIMNSSKGRPVIQMPQSIHFDDPRSADATARAIAEHGQVTLLTRDHESLAFVQKNFDCQVQMCPDMAFALGPLARPVQPYRDVLLLLRRDEEAANHSTGVTLPDGWDVEDWLAEPKNTRSIAAKRAKLNALRSLNPRRLTKTARTADLYTSLVEMRVSRGLHQLASARYVITDRLHVHILCTLMGIPHTILDNYYGKIGRFSTAFGTAWSGVSQAKTLSEAVSLAKTHLSQNETGRAI